VFGYIYIYIYIYNQTLSLFLNEQDPLTNLKKNGSKENAGLCTCK